MRLLASLLIVVLISSGPAFAAVDANGDGKVTLDELIGYKLAAAPFGQRDRNSNGFLDPQELPGLANEEKLADAYDADHDGVLSPSEYGDYIADFAIAAMVTCDANGDEYLTGIEAKCGVEWSSASGG